MLTAIRFSREIALKQIFAVFLHADSPIALALHCPSIQASESDGVDAALLTQFDQTLVAKSAVGHQDEIQCPLVGIYARIAGDRSDDLGAEPHLGTDTIAQRIGAVHNQK